MKCSYCMQQEDGNNHKADVDKFIENFVRFIELHNITINSVHYQGGEPLLYMNKVKRVIDSFVKEYPNISLHRITTNGTLIDGDYVNFCNQYSSIYTVVSLHEFSIPSHVQKSIGKLNNLSISGVIHAEMPLASSYYFEWYDPNSRELPKFFDKNQALA